MNTLRMRLRTVFYHEDGEWVAHCLEFDLAGTGPTKAQALRMLMDAISIQIDETIESGNIDNLFCPADSRIFRMYASGRDVLDSQLELKLPQMRSAKFEFEGGEIREYLTSTAEPALT